MKLLFATPCSGAQPKVQSGSQPARTLIARSQASYRGLGIVFLAFFYVTMMLM